MTQPLVSRSPETPAFPGAITLPYTLTAGRAAGTFLAELANRRIIGSRCPDCSKVMVPAQDFCATCGAEAGELVKLPETGELVGFTETAAGVLGLVRFDGADTPMVHRVLDASLASLSLGERVAVQWAPEAVGSILDIAGFVEASGDGSAGATAQPFASEAEPLAERPYELELHYRHAYGPYYGRLFDELGTSRRILGVKCPSCESVLVPPREYCDACFVRTAEWVDVAHTGVIQAFSIIHLEFVGQTREPPYIYAEIVLDGAATRLIHSIGGIDVEDARRTLEPGMRVRAVWKDDEEPTGTLEDIRHFELIREDGER
jgi:uncharacterized OB-fold protein